MSTPNLNLNLKFRTMWWSDEIGNGYRMATVAEVRNHFDTIARLGIPPLHPHRPLNEGKNMHLVDGYMTYPSHHHFQIQETYKRWLDWKVVVKEKEWDEDEGRWRSNSSACDPSEGVFLRKHVYDHLTLSPQARRTALLNCCEGDDVELLHWLLKTTSTDELKQWISSSDKLYGPREYVFTYRGMVRYLLRSRFPFELPLELDSHGNTAISYVIESAKSEKNINCLRVMELFVELFSADIVHRKNSSGKSFLDLAEQEADEGGIYVFTKLLSLSQQPLQTHLESIIPRFQSVLLEAIERGYRELVDKLLDLKSEMSLDASSLLQVLRVTTRKGSFHLLQKLLTLYSSELRLELFAEDKDQKTLLHYAAESGSPDVLQLLLTLFYSVNGIDKFGENVLQIVNVHEKSTLLDLLKSRDNKGRTALHIAAESGNPDVFRSLFTSPDSVKGGDKFGKNVLHCAAQGKSGYQIVDILQEKESTLLDLMKSRDNRGRTPFHIASSKGSKNMVVKLLAVLGDDKDKITTYVKETDNFGRTALQMACCGGHRELVEMLLQKAKWNPLEERDLEGKTALHYAAQARDPEDAVAICKQLLEIFRDSSERALLLWAAAGGIGTADEGDGVHSFVKSFLQNEKESDRTHLLREAALQNNVEIAWELINRGAKMDDLRDRQWYKNSYPQVRNVLHQLELLKEQGRDQPSIEDKLGRSVFAEGLAALFLNGFIESPITVGICGEWGMGKSSLMIQTEKILLMTAAQLTFPNLLKSENFVGAQKISLSRKGLKIYETIRKGAFSLLVQKEDKSLFFKICDKIKELWRNFVLKQKGPLVTMLEEYKPQYHSVYKSLACMDICQILDSQQSHALGRVPRILTVQYNAWQYHDQHEAWAGLAVTITKEIEKSMTRAQWFSTGWRYSWNKNNVKICFEVLLPCFLAAFLAGWIAWVAWILLEKHKFQDLKYGSIPLTIMITLWTVLKSIISVVKPVSVQMMGYITSPDHTSRLGYQEQVISDINFLKTELGRRPHWFFSLILILGEWWEWCWNWFGICSNNVENTIIMKFRPASEDQLRIITFVDDLDRCEEKVILEVLSAVNLVLARCKINVVLGIDKKMIERAIRRSFEDVEDIDIADKFMCKIIQIPLSLPDPTQAEMNNFLKYQLGREPETRSSFQDEDDTDYGTSDDEPPENNESVDQGRENRVVDIDCCDPLVPRRCQSIIGKAFNWLSCFLKISYSIACNISSELQPPRDQPDDREKYPLTFSKGARLTREMLITKYTDAEADTFEKLKRFATADRKLPREWKRLFNYHRLAWNILIKRRDVYCLTTWKVELVAWTFVCWQWKHEMNTIIKGWSRHTEIEKISSRDNQGDDNAESCNGPPLSEIVKKCVQVKFSGKNKESIKKDDDYLKVRGQLRQDHLLSLYVQGHVGSIVEDPSQNSWAEIQEALRIQDVSMKGIQLFQQFRLHCETDHLPWPPLNQSKSVQSQVRLMEV